jgi:hypothetical protein
MIPDSVDIKLELDRAAPRNQRVGLWTMLELIDMDVRFCQAMARAHPELAEPPARAEPERTF